MVSLLFWAMRGIGEQSEPYGESLLLPAVRLLQDCPANAIAARKVLSARLSYRSISDTHEQDLWVVLQHIIRHLSTGPSRRIVLTHIDKLLDENVLLGTSTSRDSLRFVCIVRMSHLSDRYHLFVESLRI